MRTKSADVAPERRGCPGTNRSAPPAASADRVSDPYATGQRLRGPVFAQRREAPRCGKIPVCDSARERGERQRAGRRQAGGLWQRGSGRSARSARGDRPFCWRARCGMPLRLTQLSCHRWEDGTVRLSDGVRSASTWRAPDLLSASRRLGGLFDGAVRHSPSGGQVSRDRSARGNLRVRPSIPPWPRLDGPTIRSSRLPAPLEPRNDGPG